MAFIDSLRKRTVKTNYFYFFIALFFVVYFLFVTCFGEYVYGSTVDWSSQHYKIPEYFRQHFYETRDLFPDFAPNIGAGQNIYNFSYYGLFNPVIMLSYLLPFVPMYLYISISTVILVYVSVILLYKWLCTKFTAKIACLSAILFMLATPLLFHTHRHIMFVDYMPFLIMALIGVDRYFKLGKRGLLTISVFLICLTSYFYSVGSILAIVLYGIYVYIIENPKMRFKTFIVDGVKFVLPILLGIAMSFFLLLPTFVALINGRADLDVVTNVAGLFLPDFSFSALLHSEYSLGLTSFALFALVYCIVQRSREARFLALTLLLLVLFPFFSYVLNGGLYARAKVLLPLLPLFILVMAVAIKSIGKEWKPLVISTGIFICFFVALLCDGGYNLFAIVDFTVIIIVLLLVIVRTKLTQGIPSRSIKAVKCMTLFVSAFLFFLSSFKEELVLTKELEDESYANSFVEYAIANDNSFYRISNTYSKNLATNKVVSMDHYFSSVYSSLSNQDYVNLYYNYIGNDVGINTLGCLMNPSNLLFDLYIGNKYVLAEGADRLGASVVKETDVCGLYENTDVLPIGYVSSHIMPTEQFLTLEYPYNAEALLNYVIVDDAEWCAVDSAIDAVQLGGQIVTMNNVEIQSQECSWVVTAGQNAELVYELEEPLSGKLVFISFDIDRINGDLAAKENTQVAINDVLNVLSYEGFIYHNQNYTFEYTLSDAVTNELKITLSPGTYKIDNLRTFVADYDEFISPSKDVEPLNLDWSQTADDVLTGTVDSDVGGYFNLSIPYDKGFSVYVDEKRIDYEKVDTAFIGFALEAGEHSIKIVYDAPGSNVGIVISVFAWLVFGYLMIKWKWKNNIL